RSAPARGRSAGDAGNVRAEAARGAGGADRVLSNKSRVLPSLYFAALSRGERAAAAATEAPLPASVQVARGTHRRRFGRRHETGRDPAIGSDAPRAVHHR